MPDGAWEGPPVEIDPLNESMWTLLRAERAPDRVPAQVRAAARESLSWRDPDSALAALVADTADDDLDAGVLAHVRGSGQSRMLTFVCDALTVEVEASWHGQVVDLVGQLVPAARTTVHVDHRGGVASADADELGRFHLGMVTPGPVRMRCRLDGAGLVHTDWVLL